MRTALLAQAFVLGCGDDGGGGGDALGDPTRCGAVLGAACDAAMPCDLDLTSSTRIGDHGTRNAAREVSDAGVDARHARRRDVAQLADTLSGSELQSLLLEVMPTLGNRS